MKPQKPILMLIMILLLCLPLLAGCSALPAEGSCGDNVKWSFCNGVLTISGTGDMDDWEDADHWEDRAGLIVKVVVEEGVTGIGNRAFPGCKNLTGVVLPQSLRSIGSMAFMDCERLPQADLPEGLESIGSGAFFHCSGLKSITIPKTVTEIKSEAFSGCESLTDIMVAEGSAAYADTNGVLLSADRTVLIQYPMGKPASEYAVPDGVETIGVAAFSNSRNLEAITLPDGLRTIESHAFFASLKLKSLTIPEGVTDIAYSTFMYCNELESVSLPSTLEALDDAALLFCEKLQNIHVAEGGKHFSSVDGILFSADRTRLIIYPCARQAAEYAIPDGVTETGKYAFDDCKGLQSVVFPQGFRVVGSCSFRNSGLKSLKLPESLTAIGFSAFDGCTSLESITIPAGVTEVECDALAHCTSLTSVTFEGAETSFYKYGVFTGSSEKLVIKGLEGSAAQAYAAKYDIPFEVITAE